MHLVEFDPIKDTKRFSCHSNIYPSLLSLLLNYLTSEEFIFLKTTVLLFMLYLLLFLCIVSSSYHNHITQVMLSLMLCNGIVSYFMYIYSDLNFLSFTQKKALNICSGLLNVHENQKQTLLDRVKLELTSTQN